MNGNKRGYKKTGSSDRSTRRKYETNKKELTAFIKITVSSTMALIQR